MQEVHPFTACDGCGLTPIIGNRFSCSTCFDFNYCLSCYQSFQLGGRSHNLAHTFGPSPGQFISGAQAPFNLIGIPEMRGICEVCAAPVLTSQNRSVRETAVGRIYHHMQCCLWTGLGCCPSLNQPADWRKKTVYIPILFSGSLPLASPTHHPSVDFRRLPPSHTRTRTRKNAHARTCTLARTHTCT